MDPTIKPAQVTITIHSENKFDSLPFVLKWLLKIGVVILGLIAILLGGLTLITVSIRCIFGGIFLILGGLFVIILEAPILCSFVTFIQPMTDFSSRRATWQKFLFYLIFPIAAIILCPSVTPIFGAICLILVALIYFFLTFRRD